MIPLSVRRLGFGLINGLVFSVFAVYSLPSSTSVQAQDSPPKSVLIATQEERKKEWVTLKKDSLEYRKSGKFAEAIATTEKMLQIEREFFGNEHEQVLGTMDAIAQLQEQHEDFAAARKSREAILAIHRKISGVEHWRTGDAQRSLEHVDVLEKLAPEDRPKVLQATLLNRVAMIYSSQGQFAAAEPLYRQSIQIRCSLLGETHPDYATSLSNLAALYEATTDYARAEPLFRNALEIRKKALGETHPAYAVVLNNLAVLYKSMGDFAKAEPLFQQALEINRVAYGETHPDFATSLNNLAMIYKSMGDLAKAELLYRQTLEIRAKALGENHPDYAMSLNNLAAIYYAMGDCTMAEPLFRQSLEIKRSAIGEANPDYASGLNNLAELYNSMADYAKAEPLYRQALEIFRTALGEKHPDYAMSLSNLAGMYHAMGDYALAEPLYLQALDIRKKVLGDNHPDCALSDNNLASLYSAMGNTAKAEPLFREALEINKKVLGENHPGYALSLNNLAEHYSSIGDTVKAEPLLRQAVDIRRKSLGEMHPSYATSLGNLASLYLAQKDDVQAEPLFQQVLAIQAVALGKNHPIYAASLCNLAGLYESRGEHSVAEPLIRESVEITRRQIESTSAVQSERQQFAMAKANRGTLSLYVSVAATSGLHAEDVYQEVLLAKGAVWRRQQMMRAAQSDPQLASLFSELRSIAARRAQKTLANPDPKSLDSWQRQIDQLTHKQEELERELSSRSTAYRDAQRLVTVGELRSSIPAGHAIVDFWEYSHFTPPRKDQPVLAEFERRMVAFVVRPDQTSVTLVSLGAVKSLEEAIDAWRQTFGQSAEAVQAGQLLRKRLWTPLEPHLEDAKVVLASPDGVLGRFPLIALPGDKPDSFLLEDRAVAIVPVPQAIVALLKATGSVRPVVEGNLLVLGDVDYDALPGRQDSSMPKKVFGRNTGALRGADWREFIPLPATGGELASIDKLYRSLFGSGGVTLLEKTEANENRFRQEAPRHKYLHIATHGFFAPESLRSALTETANRRSGMKESGSYERFVGNPPGLLSGLAMAGANRVPDGEVDDGILTASEVESLDLRGVQLVVLSACETGLGEVAGGEGLLGLQRAFQVAGAQTVVASLWQVSDTATRSLMERFYDNLLRKEMGTLDALREAQLWMLREGQERGMVRRDQPKPANEQKRTPPFYWGAFVLSGDWR